MRELLEKIGELDTVAVIHQIAIKAVGYVVFATTVNELMITGAIREPVAEALGVFLAIFLVMLFTPEFGSLVRSFEGWSMQWGCGLTLWIVLSGNLLSTQPWTVAGSEMMSVYIAVGLLPVLYADELPPSVVEWIQRQVNSHAAEADEK